MRKHQIESAAFDIATQVRTVEDMIDGALTEMAELQSRMIRARSVMGVGPATGQAALAQLANSLQALVTARGEMAQCHGELAQAKMSVPGLRATSYGDTNDCPPPQGLHELRVVA